jgi:hypothetical protein
MYWLTYQVKCLELPKHARSAGVVMGVVIFVKWFGRQKRCIEIPISLSSRIFFMNVNQACTHILAQFSDLLLKLTADQYAMPATVLNNNSVGQHLRHTLEFFLCLERGAKEGVVNYDQRQHDKLIESDKYIAASTISRIVNFINNSGPDVSLILEASYGLNNDELIRVETNLTRELVYNIEHAVHHMAIMKMAIREVAPSLSLPDDFGIAASTLRYKAKAQTVSQHS